MVESACLDYIALRRNVCRERNGMFRSQVDVVIDPKDIVMKFKRASGPGGQHVNKTETAVQILHIPTGNVAPSTTA